MSEELLYPLLWLIPVAPLASAIVTALLGPKVLKYRSHLPCWSALAVSFLSSLVLLYSLPSVDSQANKPEIWRAGENATAQAEQPAGEAATAQPESTDGGSAASGESEESRLAAAVAALKAKSDAEPKVGPEIVAFGFEWLHVGKLEVPFELRVDSISAIMLSMVTGVSLLVAMFGSGYMHHDAGYPRFFAAV